MCTNCTSPSTLYRWSASFIVENEVGLISGELLNSTLVDLGKEGIEKEAKKELEKRGIKNVTALNVRYVASPAGGFI